MTTALPPLRAHDSDLLWVDDGVAFTRDAAGWTFTWSTPDVNCVWNDSKVLTVEELVQDGPPVRMTAEALDSLAHTLGREPSSLSWCRDRRLLERIVADDPEGVRAQLAAMGADARVATTVGATLARTSGGGHEPILTIALGAAAWAVAEQLIRRGEPLEAPPRTVWTAANYAIEALDDSVGATAVLRHLIARGDVVPSADLLCHVRAPRIVYVLVDAGAHPDVLAPLDGLLSSPLQPAQLDATPLAIAVVRERFDVAAALLERGASLEARDAQGRTALIVAVQGGDEAPVRWLLDHGVALECTADIHGRTPRSLALARPDDPGSRLLLAALAERRAAPPTVRMRELEILLAKIQRANSCLANYALWSDRGKEFATPEYAASMEADASRATRELTASKPALDALVATTRAEAPAEMAAWVAAHDAFLAAFIDDCKARGDDSYFATAARAAWAEVRDGARAYAEDSGGVTENAERFRRMFGIDPHSLEPVG